MWADRLVDALGWALLHSLWQVGVVALGAATILTLLRRRSAASRYAVAYGGLLLMVALPCLTAWVLATPLTGVRTGPAPAFGEAAAESPVLPVELPVVELPGPVAAFAAGAASRLDPLLPWMVACWLLGVATSATRLAGGYIQVRRLRRRGVLPVPERWQRTFAGLAERLRIRRPVRLVASARLLVPAACGWLRPMVIVPLGVLTGLPPAQVESILAHELAHVRRHDYLLNLLQCVAEMLLFYHPAAWWLSARVRAERENCCDDLAVAVCGDARTYAQALAGIEMLRAAPVPVPALAASGGSLLARIRRLVAPPPVAAEAGPRVAAAGLLGATVVVACLALAVRADVPTRDATAPAGTVLVSTAFSWEDELRVESTCDQWEKPRRCIDEDGHGRFECAVKSPLAAVLRALQPGRSQDPQVRVETIRRASDGVEPRLAEPTSESRLRAATQTAATATPDRIVTEHVIVTDLPHCRTSPAISGRAFGER
ncbi:MAG TPA: M56 family metallopeptidase [Thermoanaerobaculia bacterium]|nr:M56 family metallopeptidase [Thermoanaerobaculia bacterium]